MRKKLMLILVFTMVTFMSLYSFISIVQQNMPDNRDVVSEYDIEQESEYKTEMTLVRYILNGVQHVFKVF